MRDKNFRYQLELTLIQGEFEPVPWRCRGRGTHGGDGMPTDENLERVVRRHDLTCVRGGENDRGFDARARSARIVDYRTGAVVASWSRE